MIRAVIFDLDGVIVSTDDCHYRAWKKLADEEGIGFDRQVNERLRGVSRMESLEIILEKAIRVYSEDEKIEMASRKNSYYKEYIQKLTYRDVLPGVLRFLDELKEYGIKIAIASSSKNCPAILERIGLFNYFDAIADGNDIRDSKPNPEVFLLAAKRVGVEPEDCLVVEDADAGVEGALAAGMKALGVGFAAKNSNVNISADSLDKITVVEILKIGHAY